jgi:hypothetical protein
VRPLLDPLFQAKVLHECIVFCKKSDVLFDVLLLNQQCFSFTSVFILTSIVVICSADIIDVYEFIRLVSIALIFEHSFALELGYKYYSTSCFMSASSFVQKNNSFRNIFISRRSQRINTKIFFVILSTVYASVE